MIVSTAVGASPGTSPMTGRQRFLAAAQMKPADVTPVWFMRQAGRSLPEYRALRERYDFMTVATTPELAARATLMPVDRLGVDAAVLFADIMLPLASIGVSFEIRPGVGPIIAAPIRSAADVDRLSFIPAREATPYVMEALRQTKTALGDRAALLGFAGAPFTLACYLIEGRPVREFPRAKALMYGQP
jgi:uroporphyrinogen decarboxylase